MRTIALALALAPLACGAADLEGRWSGAAGVPGRDLPLVIDLAPDASSAWAGSLTIPGFDVKGARLVNIRVSGDDVTFETTEALVDRRSNEPATFAARVRNGMLEGELKQAAGVATIQLKRVGAAQVEPVRRSVPVSAAAEGRWIGRFELGGYPRDLTIDIANQRDAAPSVEFVVVGRATTKLPIDYVGEQEGMLRLESKPYGMTFEGRLNGNEVAGTLELGAAEFPLVLRRPS